MECVLLPRGSGRPKCLLDSVFSARRSGERPRLSGAGKMLQDLRFGGCGDAHGAVSTRRGRWRLYQRWERRAKLSCLSGRAGRYR